MEGRPGEGKEKRASLGQGESERGRKTREKVRMKTRGKVENSQ